MKNPSSTSISMMLVEDDPESGEAMKDMLERRSVQVQLLRSADTAIPGLFANPFDILVTDIRLGRSTGIDLLHQVRERDPDFPVILITGYDDINSAIEAVRLGAQNYILKPLDTIEDLLVPAQRAVTNHRMRKQTQALEESKRRLGQMLVSTTDFVFLFDTAGRFTFCNREAGSADLWRPVSDILGKSHKDVMPPDVDALFSKSFSDIREGKSGEYDYSLDIAGVRRHFSTKLTPLMEGGQFSGAMAIVRDITERVVMEEHLKTQHDAIEASMHAVAFVDLAGRLTHVNRAFMAIWGCRDNRDVLGRSAADFWTSVDGSVNVSDIVRSRGQWSGELTVRRQNGAPVAVRGSTNLVHDYSGRPVCMVGCFEDVTAERRAQNELVAYQQKLRQLTGELTLAEESERKRIAMGLHESVAQLLSLAKSKLSVMPDSLGHTKPALQREIGDLAEWIGKALAETKTLAFDLYPPALYSEGLEFALRSLVERMSGQWKLRMNVQDDKERIPLGENRKILLYRATEELLLNACKHSGAKRVTLAISHEGGCIRITVSDNGRGFDTQSTGWTGLGLFTISERLRSVGGTFEIHSHPGQGTVATLSASPGEGRKAARTPRKTGQRRKSEAT